MHNWQFKVWPAIYHPVRQKLCGAATGTVIDGSNANLTEALT